jgi:MYXO-CTERM domain-containing protein
VHPYTEQGFVVFGDLLSTCTGSPAYGGPAAHIGVFLSTASIAAVDASPFSLFSIDLAKLSDVEMRAGPLSFTGHLLGGGAVTQTFTVDWTGPAGPPVFSTFNFSEAFTNLVSVDLPPNGSFPLGLPEYQFTNVHLNAVTPTPEPASWLLAATALAGLGGIARVRRRRG